jgi:hypothetical protein
MRNGRSGWWCCDRQVDRCGRLSIPFRDSIHVGDDSGLAVRQSVLRGSSPNSQAESDDPWLVTSHYSFLFTASVYQGNPAASDNDKCAFWPSAVPRVAIWPNLSVAKQFKVFLFDRCGR